MVYIYHIKSQNLPTFYNIYSHVLVFFIKTVKKTIQCQILIIILSALDFDLGKLSQFDIFVASTFQIKISLNVIHYQRRTKFTEDVKLKDTQSGDTHIVQSAIPLNLKSFSNAQSQMYTLKKFSCQESKGIGSLTYVINISQAFIENEVVWSPCERNIWFQPNPLPYE